MKEPFNYKLFNAEEKYEFLILSYKGYFIERQGIEKGWTNGDRLDYTGGNCSVVSHGRSEDETYAYIVENLICKKEPMIKYRHSKSWDKLIPIILKLRGERCFKQAFKNQMNQIDHYLNYLDIETTVKYIAGAINVLNGKRGEYPI